MSEITNGDLMKVLLEIKGDVGETKGSLSSLTATFGDEKLRTRATELGMDERMRKVENKVHGWSAASGVLGVLASYLGLHVKW